MEGNWFWNLIKLYYDGDQRLYRALCTFFSPTGPPYTLRSQKKKSFVCSSVIDTINLCTTGLEAMKWWLFSKKSWTLYCESKMFLLCVSSRLTHRANSLHKSTKITCLRSRSYYTDLKLMLSYKEDILLAIPQGPRDGGVVVEWFTVTQVGCLCCFFFVFFFLYNWQIFHPKKRNIGLSGTNYNIRLSRKC